MRILLVDDDESIIEVLTKLLLKQNYVVDVARDGITAWELVQGFQYDLILLDVMLPKLDGISFCRRLREQNNPVLVMLLTARDTTNDKLMGLDSGADDYVVKPFHLPELTARIRALSRRVSTSTSVILKCGELQLDTNSHEVTYQGKLLLCSRTEYLLMELLLRNQKRVYNCRQIIDNLWAFDDEPPNESTVRSHIKNIRRQLKAVGAEDFLETVYGQGYRINPAFISGSHQPTVDNSVKQETLIELDKSVAEIWQRTKNLTFERLTVLEQVLLSLQAGIFDKNSQKLAIQNAHKLAGSLGMFGFNEGTDMTRKIEVILQSIFTTPLHSTPAAQNKFAQQLEPLVVALRHQIELSTGETINLPIQTQDCPQFASIHAKIIAVDDDPQILMSLTSLLKPLDVELTCLSSPEGFWETLNSTHPDFLILDINMPSGTEGLDLCREVRQNHEWNWLPILFLTSCTDAETMQKAFVTGADDYLTKPIVPQELLIRISNRLQRIRSLRNSL
jgi:DNA-binding response OmpR family regulator/HPt (histidine-containing phosphotransfer) domain-containing protein